MSLSLQIYPPPDIWNTLDFKCNFNDINQNNGIKVMITIDEISYGTEHTEDVSRSFASLIMIDEYRIMSGS